MSVPALVQLTTVLAVVAAFAWPLGGYVARVLRGDRVLLARPLGGLERLLYRAAGVAPDAETGWRGYALALLAFSAIGIGVLVAVQMAQGVLPYNPEGFPGVRWDTAIDTAVSFVTNTNWQSYAGESSLSPLTQMLGLTVQNFVSAASGIAVCAALARGIARTSTGALGNFWVDLVRITLYVLLPLCVVFALVLVACGVPQTWATTLTFTPLEGGEAHRAALGPVASQIAIKMLGSNGGGYFNTNAAHPFENPSFLGNLLQTVAMLLLPFGLCRTYGILVSDPRQGRALLCAMLVLFLPVAVLTMHVEESAAPYLQSMGVDATASALQSGGNLEGKEVRFGPAASGLFASVTTAVSCGAVDAMHDSFLPLGGLGPLWLMQIGEVVFGGVGSGLYGLLVFVVVAVFVAGLMVGRTPEYLGKKLGAFEMRMASLALLIPALAVLFGTAIAVATAAGRAGVANPGPHGFTEILYGCSSAANNNGSAFAGLSAGTPFYNLMLAVLMLLGRFGVAVPVLALAGGLAAKRRLAEGAGTLPTHGGLFLVLLVGVVLLVGALAFLPALALGPVIEHLQLAGSR